jgi:hypothetical protein
MQTRSLLREPLIHFLLIGAGLFLLFGWLNRDGFDAPNEIVVDSSQIAQLRSQFQRIWQRPPTDDELVGLVQDWIRQEVLYREGLALGVDQDDPVTRRRIVQKMEFMSDAFVNTEFTDAELQEWLDENMEAYRVAPRYSFRQVFFDPQRHGTGLDGTLAESLRVLERDPAAVTGDPTLLPQSMEDASTTEISRSFGEQFTAALADAPLGVWTGPVRSGYGWHLLRISDKKPGRKPALEEVRAAVGRDLLAERTRRAGETYYEALRERYTVRVSEDVSVTLDTAMTGQRQ